MNGKRSFIIGLLITLTLFTVIFFFVYRLQSALEGESAATLPQSESY